MKHGSGLQTIFAFFLGLTITAFIGVGVYTFYPSPQKELSRQIEDLSRQEHAIRNSRAADSLTAADRSRLQEIRDQMNRAQDAGQGVREQWGLATSIILIVFATLIMTISLLKTEQLPAISNGLLLGGVFVMIYGVCWIIASDPSVTRFVVMTVALLITLIMGYIRFVRRRTIATASDGVAIASGQALVNLEERLRDIERRLDEAANASGFKGDRK